MDAAKAADGTANGTGDPFSRFWMDLMSNMSSGGFAGQGTSNQSEYTSRARRAFFDAWANHCDEFMRSPTFLDAMKKSMDASLAFKQQVNEFLMRSLHESQMPTRGDTDSIMMVLRSMEERVLSRIDRLTQRVEAIEDGGKDRGTAKVDSAAQGGKGSSHQGPEGSRNETSRSPGSRNEGTSAAQKKGAK